MSNTTATIPVADEIPLILTVVNAKTGQPVPNAVLSNVQWTQTNAIGTIISDPENPNQAIFKPSGTGAISFQAEATVTIS